MNNGECPYDEYTPCGHSPFSILHSPFSIMRSPLNNINSLQIFLVLQFGNLVLIGILLAKSGLPTELISIYEALVFLASLFCFYWIVAGQNALLQLFPKLNIPEQKRAIFNSWFLFTLLGILSGGLLFSLKNIIATRLTNFDELPYLDLLSIFLVFHSPAFLLHIYYLLLKKYKAIVIFGAVSFSVQLLVVVLPIYLGYTLRETFMGLIFWAIFRYLWGIYILVKNAEWKLDFVFFKTYLPLIAPLLLLAFIGKGSEYISGLLVTSMFEDDKVFAIFRYGAREFPLAVLLVGGLATSLLPEVSENIEGGLVRIREKTKELSRWLFPLSVVSMLASPVLFPLFFNPDFKASAYIFNIFTLLLASRILLPQVVVMALRKNYFLTISAFVELIVLTLLSWWWGTEYGLHGIAWAAVVAFAFERVILVTYTWKWLGIRPGKYIHVPSYIGWNILLFGGFWLSLNI